jgi:hypothetical protein
MAAIKSLLRIRPVPVMPRPDASCCSSGKTMPVKPVRLRAASVDALARVDVDGVKVFLPWCAWSGRQAVAQVNLSRTGICRVDSAAAATIGQLRQPDKRLAPALPTGTRTGRCTTGRRTRS